MVNLMNTKDVALALSSGGARGLAHIGAIEELESNGYHITSIAGCSMGALIGGVYAAGKLEEFREWMKTIDRKKMLELTDFSFSINHLVKGNRIIEAIMDFVPDIAIEELPIPYCAVATDLKAGREVVIDKGSLFEAIRASISLDILVGVDVSGHDYKSQWDEMHRLTEWQKNDNSLKAKILDKLIPDNIEFNYYTVLSRTSSLMIRQNSILMAKLMKPEMLIDIQMSRYGGFDYDKSEKIIAIGRQKTSLAITKFEQNSKSRDYYLI